MSLAARLYVSLIIVVGCAFLKQNTWYTLSVYAALSFIWAGVLRARLPKLAALLGTELLFLLFLTLPLGWERASFLLVRAFVCLLTMNSFLLTLPPHSFGIALKSLPLPSIFKQSLLLAGQYIEILLLEVERMQRSAQLRGLSGTAAWLRYASAAMIGALYLRSLDRAERVYAAMIVRGYSGEMPVDSELRPKELYVVILISVIALSLTIASWLYL
ncbi:MAG: energy-coupling factor transporter transmembrane protein EcfT [Calothrix sp. C42_A2020_038]|nr:energy-coupling factor transporter transmembrane protein EcfT [Calothrix sp. C42_A2020_038]